MRGLCLLVLVGLLGCQPSSNDVVSDFTGNETTYDLQAGSIHNVTGTIVFKERRDGQITALVNLKGTDGSQLHPVHMHLGAITTPDADVALLLNPVHAATGKSETVFSTLADESKVTYKQLTDLEACVKIHLGDIGDDRNVILAGGNIGLSFKKASPGGRMGIATCKSE